MHEVGADQQPAGIADAGMAGEGRGERQEPEPDAERDGRDRVQRQWIGGRRSGGAEAGRDKGPVAKAHRRREQEHREQAEGEQPQAPYGAEPGREHILDHAGTERVPERAAEPDRSLQHDARGGGEDAGERRRRPNRPRSRAPNASAAVRQRVSGPATEPSAGAQAKSRKSTPPSRIAVDA